MSNTHPIIGIRDPCNNTRKTQRQLAPPDEWLTMLSPPPHVDFAYIFLLRALYRCRWASTITTLCLATLVCILLAFILARVPFTSF